MSNNQHIGARAQNEPDDSQESLADDTLHAEVTEALVAMGFQRKDIDEAIESLVRGSGTRVSVGDALEVLLNANAEPDSDLHPPQTCDDSTSACTCELPFDSESASSSDDPFPSVASAAHVAPKRYSTQLQSDENDLSEVLNPTRGLSSESRETAAASQGQGVLVQSAVPLPFCDADDEQRCMITPLDQTRARSMIRESSSDCARARLASAEARHSEEPRRSCPICFDEIADSESFRLGCGHLYCRDFMKGLCDAVALPACPDTACGYMLAAAEVGTAAGDSRQQAFQALQLRRVVDQLSGRVDCPNPECNNVVLCDMGERVRVDCHCGWPSFCSCCRQTYHAHKECNEVAQLREKWVQWIVAGRQKYHGQVEASKAAAEQQQAAQEALRRQHELLADEEYKSENCRSCPKCGRCVQKLAGCDSMKCGENYHGGDKQDGCGAKFNWTSAPKYTACVERRPVPKVDFESLTVEGKDVRHLLIRCDGCQTTNFRGPRFRCVHCPEFNLCVDCDLAAASAHPADHVFDIILTSEHAIPQYLPFRTEIEFVGMRKNVALNGKRATVTRCVAVAGTQRSLYDLKLKEAFQVPLAEESAQFSSGIQGLVSMAQHFARRLCGDAEADEISLTPGSTVCEVKAVPSSFIQLVVGSDLEAVEILEAADTQRRAMQRGPWTAMPHGTRVLISGLLKPAVRARGTHVLELGAPQEGKCPHFSDPKSCATCRWQPGSAVPRTDFSLQAGVARIAGPYLASTRTFAVRVSDVPGLWEVASESVRPVVTRQYELERLEEFEVAQEEARKISLGLLQGQRVEVLHSEEHSGKIAEVAGAYNDSRQGYPVKLADEGVMSEMERAWAFMSECYTLEALMGLSKGQLADIWNTYGLPCARLESPDAFIEQALTNMPEKRPPLVLPASFLQPLILDPSELWALRGRAEGISTTAIHVEVASSDTHDVTRTERGEDACKCAKCGEPILGCVVSIGGQAYHFGCSQ